MFEWGTVVLSGVWRGEFQIRARFSAASAAQDSIAKRVDIGRRGQFLIRDEMMGKVCSSS